MNVSPEQGQQIAISRATANSSTNGVCLSGTPAKQDQ